MCTTVHPLRDFKDKTESQPLYSEGERTLFLSTLLGSVAGFGLYQTDKRQINQRIKTVLITHTHAREFTKKNAALKGSQNLGSYVRLDKEKWAWGLAGGRRVMGR